MEKSHKLTLAELEKRNTELIEIDLKLVAVQKKNQDLDKVLKSTREALKESEAHRKKDREELDLVMQNYRVAKKNCQKYEAALEKAKNAVKSISSMMT